MTILLFLISFEGHRRVRVVEGGRRGETRDYDDDGVKGGKGAQTKAERTLRFIFSSGTLSFFSVDLSPPREFWPLDPLPPVQTIPQDHARDDCVFTPMNGISIRERASKCSLGEQPPLSTRRLANLIG